MRMRTVSAARRPTVSSEKTWVVIILSESLNISLRDSDSVSRRSTRVAQVHWSAYERERPTPACHSFHSADLCPTQTLASCVEGTTLPTIALYMYVPYMNASRPLSLVARCTQLDEHGDKTTNFHLSSFSSCELFEQKRKTGTSFDPTPFNLNAGLSNP